MNQFIRIIQLKILLKKYRMKENQQPNQSEVWIFYDNDNLYFGANFLDSSPETIDQNLMRRDNIISSDWLLDLYGSI